MALRWSDLGIIGEHGADTSDQRALGIGAAWDGEGEYGEGGTEYNGRLKKVRSKLTGLSQVAPGAGVPPSPLTPQPELPLSMGCCDPLKTRSQCCLHQRSHRQGHTWLQVQAGSDQPLREPTIERLQPK